MNVWRAYEVVPEDGLAQHWRGLFDTTVCPVHPAPLVGTVVDRSLGWVRCVTCRGRGWRHVAEWPEPCPRCGGRGRLSAASVAALAGEAPTTFRAYLAERCGAATRRRINTRLWQLFGACCEAPHDWGGGLMPESGAVECVRCGASMRRTGDVRPHVEFKLAPGAAWSPVRPGCRAS